MAYGMEIRNGSGQLVFDDNRPSMYEIKSGTTQFSSKIGGYQVALVQNFYLDLARYWGFQASQTTQVFLFDAWTPSYHICGGGFTETNIWWNGALGDVPNGNGDLDDLFFVQIPSYGIYQMVSINMKLPEAVAGGNLLVGLQDNAPGIPYKVFSANAPPLPPGETYGLQTFAPDGSVNFDSRHKTLGMEVFFITAAQFNDVLANGNNLNLTLKTPKPGAYVSSPLWLNALTEDYRIAVPRIVQLNDSTLQLTRTQIGLNGGLSPQHAVLHDAILMVIRNA